MLPIIVRFSELSHLIRRIELCENCGVSTAGTGSEHLQRFVSRFSENLGRRKFENELGKPGDEHEQLNEVDGLIECFYNEMLLTSVRRSKAFTKRQFSSNLN